MIRTIANKNLSVAVKQSGAELCSLKSASGVEYLWQADPAIWPRHAPLLFPIVGKLANDRYIYDGKPYELKQHGFARDMDFSLVEEKADRLCWELVASPQTMLRYPFDFSLRVTYGLSNGSVEIVYEVHNNGRSVMPFSIGGHPGFALTWEKDDRIEDYFLEFEKPETLLAHLLDENHLLSEQTRPVPLTERQLPITKDLFDQDALILLEYHSEKIHLRSQKSPNSLTVELAGFPYLGLWAKPGAPFVCIEPWHGHVDPASHTDGQIMNKPGIIKLEPGRRFSCTHRIVIDEEWR
jgi:galactose mutarotase-like enzyme